MADFNSTGLRGGLQFEPLSIILDITLTHYNPHLLHDVTGLRSNIGYPLLKIYPYVIPFTGVPVVTY